MADIVFTDTYDIMQRAHLKEYKPPPRSVLNKKPLYAVPTRSTLWQTSRKHVGAYTIVTEYREGSVKVWLYENQPGKSVKVAYKVTSDAYEADAAIAELEKVINELRSKQSEATSRALKEAGFLTPFKRQRVQYLPKPTDEDFDVSVLPHVHELQRRGYVLISASSGLKRDNPANDRRAYIEFLESEIPFAYMRAVN